MFILNLGTTKMRTRRIKITIALALAMMAGCNKATLDRVPLDSLNEAIIWSDENLVEGVVRNLYWAGLTKTYCRTGGSADCLEVDTWTDNVLNTNDNAVTLEAFSPTSLPGRIGSYAQYDVIRRASLIIDELNSDRAFTDNEVKRKRFIAEARCMRALVYGWMARRWGGLMIVDRKLSPADELALPRSSEADTYAFIIDDLKKAIPDLPSGGTKERFTKGAALTLLLRIAVDAHNWDEAIAAGDALLYGKEGTWAIDRNYNQLFGNYDYPVSSPEIMFYLTYGPNKTVADNLLAMYIGSPTPIGRNLKGPAFTVATDAWCVAHPSQEIVDAYLVIDPVDGKPKKYNETHRWLAAGADTTAYLMYNQPRDARFEQTIVRDSAYYFGNHIVTSSEGNVYWDNVQNHPFMTKSGYIWRKWVEENPNRRAMYQQNFQYRYVLLRLGEAYLNYAEALARKGRIADAVRAVNITRVEHGGLPALDAGISPDEFWKWYKLERRVELVMEGDRYFSLIRWARVEGATGVPELNRRTHAIDIAADNSYKFVDSHGFGTNYIFSWPRRMYFPIPESEVINNPNINTNNPGW